MVTLRLFIAIGLSPDVIEEIARCQERLKREVNVSVAWTDPKGIHLTLKFLGETDEARIPEIEERLRLAAHDTAPFALTLGRFGVFPSLARPRVLWVGVDGEVQKLASLQRKVEQGMAALGFPAEDRPFSPHLTVGRVRPQQRQGVAAIRPDVAGDVHPIPQPVTSMGLIQSRLTPRGAIYTRLSDFPLHG